MKLLSLLPLAVAASALVIPDAETFESLEIQGYEQESHPFWDNIKDPSKIWDELEEKFDHATQFTKHKVYDAVEYVQDTAVQYGNDFQTAFAAQAWMDSREEEEAHPPHHPPHHGPPGKKPHRRPHHKEPTKTVYELIAGSEHFTKLAAAISAFPDLVELLNGTSANFTIFAPTDRAFDKVPKDAPTPPKEFLKKLLTYHVSPEFYPAGRILVSKTVPTALKAEFIDDNPQRIATQASIFGLSLNFYSKVVHVNTFGTNGVIHAINNILLPPPKAVDILGILPTYFSTLELALVKTGLYEAFNNTDLHVGGTLFAPTNLAFSLLGPKINGFLFSPPGEKYLKALLLYHAGRDVTLYSDAIYKTAEPSMHIPKDFYHIDIPTGLEGKSLSIDTIRYGRIVILKINGFVIPSAYDGVAADGVIHTVPVVLIPPREAGGPGEVAQEGMSLEDFKARLEPHVESDEYDGFEL